MISTGGIIVATLTYIGFRKYRGEKQKTRMREKEKGAICPFLKNKKV
ncbi:sporulation protein YpjB [Anoxybacteroides voinovskiense]|nr:sporulation protein YpjB [Anoxybacillus voinovskiensis]